MIDIPEEKDKLAIVVVGYNKLNGLKRLLSSLDVAKYPNSNIPLVISVDASGNKEVYSFVEEYRWKHGNKYVNIENERLGLKKHIFQCASLSKYFKGVIVLEDDLMVSPYFFEYSQRALDKYGDDNRIAGIALYEWALNGFAGLPYSPVSKGSDVYACQAVCSWGEIWNYRMWTGFTSWLNSWDGSFDSIDMLKRIKNWTRAWSKYYYAYLVQTNKFFIFPYQSLSTNFNDAGGEHGGGNSSVVQVPLLQGQIDYQFGDFDDLVKYDVYAQNLEISEWLGLKSDELTVDFFGLKEQYGERYVLAPFQLPYKRIRGFSLSMRPWELNIKYNIEGNDILLYDRENSFVTIPPSRKFSSSYLMYFFGGFNVRLLIQFIFKYIWSYTKVKLQHFL